MSVKKAIGFYLVVISAILAAVSLTLYSSVFAKTDKVNTFLLGSIIAGVVVIGFSFAVKNELTNLVAVVYSTLLFVAFCFSISPMVTPIAYWYAGLYDYSTVSAYFTFAIVVGAAWFLSIVSAFTGVLKVKK